MDIDKTSTATIVAALVYKPGWAFKYVPRADGDMLAVYALTIDSMAPTRERITQHMRPIPSDTSGRDLVRWVYRFLLEVERHECAEFLQVDGLRPFYPGHGDDDPYEHREVWA